MARPRTRNTGNSSSIDGSLDGSWTPTQPVDNPILNVPYEEPKEHWVYEKQGSVSVPRRAGGRRDARYFYKTKQVGTAQQELAVVAEEGQDKLELVNRLRIDVRRWRESGYRGASSVTRELFAFWFDKNRARRLFFCQREAIETIVYLLEIAIPGRLGSTGFKSFSLDAATLQALLRGDKTLAAASDEFWPRLVEHPSDSSLLPLRRLGCKMATGSGKTVVMAMIIAWALTNRGRNPSSRQFPSGVLVCAPNLTVRRRLNVLRPDEHPNYYEEFDLVPPKFRELLAAGKVLVTNWHALALKSEHREGDASYPVVQKGEETNDAFTKDRLGELADRLPILVLNDEGHHCWRPNPGEAPETEELTPEEKKVLEEDAEEARVWLAGLDRINNCGLIGPGEPGILATIDLSATPFYLSNSGYPEGSPFPWLVSDFGLLDAIESGIVKIPRLPIRDDVGKKDEAGRPDPKYFRLWRHIVETLKPADRVGRRWKPNRVFDEAQFALNTLASQWVGKFNDIQQKATNERAIPPVMIVVCENTELAQIVFENLSGEREIETLDDKGKTVKRTVYQTALFPELQNDESRRNTIRIDTKLLAKIETQEGESKDEAAQALRAIIDSVGKRGGPGEQVRCVVSVAMLTEGWDATNVTHVLGIRAFDSQLLCEQVVGRGLRRMSYDPGPDGKLAPEYVDVYGVPFSLIPYKGKPPEKRETDPIQRRIFPVPEKAQYAMRMPIVESYTYDVRRSILQPDLDKMAGFILDREEPTTVYLTAPRGYEEHGAPPVESKDFVTQTRDGYYDSVRWQQVLFRLTQLIIDDLVKGATGRNAELMRQNLQARQLLFPQILRVVDEYVDKKVTFKKRPDGRLIDKRELAHEKYARLLSERIRVGLSPSVADDKSPLLPIVNSYEEYASTESCDFHTTRPVRRLYKSHLNAAVVNSLGTGDLIGESTAIDVLEELESVECFAPNHKKIGFVIYYEYGGEPRRYEPDFLVRMRGGRTVLLEIKGGGGEVWAEDEVKAKEASARKWVAAVNNAGAYGRWAYEICRDLKELRGLLEGHAEGTKVLPFRTLARRPRAGEEVAVRFQRLKIAAGRADRFQIDETSDWVVPTAATAAITSDMVIAQIEGDSMAPRVLPGEYCLFAPVSGVESGMTVLAELRTRTDMPGGGRYVLKQFKQHSDGQVVLESINKTYDPIIVKEPDELRIVARLVEVLRTASLSSAT